MNLERPAPAPSLWAGSVAKLLPQTPPPVPRSSPRPALQTEGGQPPAASSGASGVSLERPRFMTTLSKWSLLNIAVCFKIFVGTLENRLGKRKVTLET